VIREEAEAAGTTRFRHEFLGLRLYSEAPIDTAIHDGVLTWTLPASTEPTRVFVEAPLGDAAAFWRPVAGYGLRLPPDWGGRADVSGILRAPFGVLHDHDGFARLGMAVSPADTAVSLRYGVSEESAAFVLELVVEPGDAPRRIVLDRSGGELFDAMAALRRQVEAPTAQPVAAAAAEPVYSTWYSFHDALDHDALLDEARLARDLGFGALFLDYGWQRFGDSRYFDGCGDWLPDEAKFPDLRRTVQEIRDLGLAVVLWVAPLLVGARSAVYPGLAAGATVEPPSLRARVLDPRRPEVHDHIVATCLRLVEDYGVDGLKIDFIDAASGYARDGDVIAHAELGAALVAALGDVRAGLDEAGHRDVLIEYREPYVGLGLAASGDVIRAEDCPGDFLANRRATLDLRVLATGQLVHSDMMMWDPLLPGPAVAASLWNAAFSVPQISMRLAGMTEEARAELGAWIAAWRAVSGPALYGRLVGLRPHLHYPSATAVLDGRALSVVWSADSVIAIPADVREAVVVNATTATRLAVRASGTVAGTTFDHRGAPSGQVSGIGWLDLEIPPGGRAELSVGE